MALTMHTTYDEQGRIAGYTFGGSEKEHIEQVKTLASALHRMTPETVERTMHPMLRRAMATVSLQLAALLDDAFDDPTGLRPVALEGLHKIHCCLDWQRRDALEPNPGIGEQEARLKVVHEVAYYEYDWATLLNLT